VGVKPRNARAVEDGRTNRHAGAHRVAKHHDIAPVHHVQERDYIRSHRVQARVNAGATLRQSPAPEIEHVDIEVLGQSLRDEAPRDGRTGDPRQQQQLLPGAPESK
jgi:hypothetical protein